MNAPTKLPAAAQLPPPIDYLNLEAHPLANLLPMIEGKDRENLKADIAKQGILEPIMLFEGRILDGRNRHGCAKEIGVKFAAANFKTFEGTAAEAEAFVFSTNFLRRQLTSAQKRAVIKTMIEKYPRDSNRQIARRCGLTSHSIVGDVRDAVDNPPERKAFDKFRKDWDALPDPMRVSFVQEFRADIEEMLTAPDNSSSRIA